MTEAADTLLIRRCLKGNVDSYGLLVDRYGDRIINLAYMMIGNRHDAEDLAQEAFVRAYRALARFQMRAKFSSWLYQITLNLCKDYLKSRSRQARHIEEEHLSVIEGGDTDVAAAPIMDAELSEMMAQAVTKLPFLYRQAFILRHLHGTDYEEIARISGVPADTVRVRAYRAREMLREILAPQVDTFWREKAEKEKGGARRRRAD